jgi:hypothetical protein
MRITSSPFKFVGLAKGLLLTFSIGFLLSCSEQEKVAPVNSQTPDVDQLTSFLATSTGFKEDQIVYDATKNEFVIDDDILITAEDAQQRLNASKGGKTAHWRGSYIIASAYVNNVDFFISADVPAVWKTATREAISNWNAINGTRLFLREVTTRSAADVTVTLGYEDANWIARAYLPTSNGRPGNNITINTKYNTMSASNKEFAITHEMGHNLGLLHTNQTSGVFINGTPTSDANSVMNSFVLPWNGFTAGDIRAVQILYPE